jgi:hypothetical protein
MRERRLRLRSRARPVRRDITAANPHPRPTTIIIRDLLRPKVRLPDRRLSLTTGRLPRRKLQFPPA